MAGSDARQDDKIEYLCRKVDEIDRVLLGEHGKLGVVAMVQILWRSYVWILCTASALLGSGLTVVVMKTLGSGH